VHEGSGYAVMKANVRRDGKQICDATLTFRVLDFPNEDMAAQMRDTAARIGLNIEAQVDG